MATLEQGLRTAVTTVLVPTARTLLRRVPRIYLDHAHTMGLGFVLNTRVQLRERPAMQASLIAHVVNKVKSEQSSLAAALRLVTRFVAQPLPLLDDGAFLRYYFNIC